MSLGCLKLVIAKIPMSKNTKATAVERATGDDIQAHFGVVRVTGLFDEMAAMISVQSWGSGSPALMLSRDSRDETCRKNSWHLGQPETCFESGPAGF